ncbi:hypothetical protein OPT61_g790 [Boeremia exigua]|uniref:Uncharacterized protein n=1 Tax=Boeremia exigua TaxID=749465 RepID=A0ACC2ISP1_9PLEO|nr:hypothetical protein OPT61_g790 [Boeremia exigua]
MRTSAIISSSLLAIAVSGAPIDLPKLPLELPSLGLLPTGVPALPGKISTEFPATLPSGLPTGVPALPKAPVNDVKLPVENLPIKRAELPVVNDLVESVKIPSLLTIPTLPKAPISNVNLPVRRVDVPIVGDVLKDVKVIDGVNPKVHLPVAANTLPVNTGLTKKNVDIKAPISVTVDDLVEGPIVNIPAVAVPAIPKTDLASRDINQTLPVTGKVDIPLDAGEIQVGTVDKSVEELVNSIKVENLPKVIRDIKQSLPVVGGVAVPLDAGNIQVGSADKYVDSLVKGTKIENLPKVAREIEQSLPAVGSVGVPLDVGKIQVGTVDKNVVEVVEGATLGNAPVLSVVKGTTVKDLPNLGRREIKQTLPVVGGVTVPLDAGKIQVGTVDQYVGDVVKGTTTGL